MSARRVLALAVALTTAAEARAQPPEPLREFLVRELRVPSAEMAALVRGDVVTRLLDRRDGRDVAALGVVRITATPDAYIDAVLRVETMRQGLGASAVGRFSDPPRLSDVAALGLDDDDIAALRRCRVGHCDVKLPAEAIARFRTEVDWSARDARRQANELFRQVLVDLVASYLRSGGAALPDYADKPEAPSHAIDARALVADSPFFARHAPELLAAFETPPPTAPRGVTDVIFWSREAQSGYKPVVTVTHLVVRRAPDGRAAYSGSRQLYASHYFDASLALTAVLASNGSPAAGVHVMYLNRSRVDALRGGWTGVKRAVANRRVRRALDAGLQYLKRRLERPFLER